MPEIANGNGSLILEQSLLSHLNSWPDKPCEIKLDELEKRGLSMMFQPLSGVKKERTYINGSYTGGFSFAIYVRTFSNDTKDKLDARQILQSLDEWWSAKGENKEYINLPVLTDGDVAQKIEMTAIPAIAARYDNGAEDYQAIFKLTYKHKEVKKDA